MDRMAQTSPKAAWLNAGGGGRPRIIGLAASGHTALRRIVSDLVGKKFSPKGNGLCFLSLSLVEESWSRRRKYSRHTWDDSKPYQRFPSLDCIRTGTVFKYGQVHCITNGNFLFYLEHLKSHQKRWDISLSLSNRERSSPSKEIVITQGACRDSRTKQAICEFDN
jgi:hypothetical protein